MMTAGALRINLLPWREARLLRRRQLFFVSIGGAVTFALLGTAGVYMLMASAVAERERHNVDLGEQISEMTKLTSEQEAQSADLRRQQAIFAQSRQLHAARIRHSRLLSALPQTLPQGLALDELRFDPTAIQLTGSAASARHVSQWLQMLETHVDIATAELQILRLNQKPGTDARQDYYYQVRLGLHGAEAVYTPPGSDL